MRKARIKIFGLYEWICAVIYVHQFPTLIISSLWRWASLIVSGKTRFSVSVSAAHHSKAMASEEAFFVVVHQAEFIPTAVMGNDVTHAEHVWRQKKKFMRREADKSLRRVNGILKKRTRKRRCVDPLYRFINCSLLRRLLLRLQSDYDEVISRSFVYEAPEQKS